MLATKCCNHKCVAAHLLFCKKVSLSVELMPSIRYRSMTSLHLGILNAAMHIPKNFPELVYIFTIEM